MRSFILNSLSVLSTFVLIEFVCFNVLNLFFGKMEIMNKEIMVGLKYKHFTFYILGAIFIFFFFDFYLPH